MLYRKGKKKESIQSYNFILTKEFHLFYKLNNNDIFPKGYLDLKYGVLVRKSKININNEF